MVLPVGWFLMVPVLAYVPIDLQRRLPDGAWAAIVILAFSTIESMRERGAPIARWAVAAVALPSSVVLLAGALRTAATPADPAFVPTEAVRAYEAVAEFARPGDAVLASFKTGNRLPAWAPVRVPIGHGPESIHLATLRPQVESMYSAEASDSERLAFLVEHSIRFVFFGPSEESLGNWDPLATDYIRVRYQAGGYRVFSVTHLDSCDCGRRGE
jgi:hypothetical protein